MSDRNSAARTPTTFGPALGAGSRLGRYEILAPLRAGGMASLFLGRRVGPAGFARPVAIKVVHAHLASDPTFVEMFLEEARLAARIQHPNVVHTEELGEERGMYYLAMEYIHGCTLSQFLARLVEQKRPLAPDVAAHIVMKLADGLHAAHEVKDEAGHPLCVVHRDISPQNVLLSYDGQVKLIDFGVAKAAGRTRETQGGFLKGKISYMSPEQAWGRPIDRRTDVYALGIVLWECLTETRLFGGRDDIAALEQVRTPWVAPPSSLASGISPELDRAVLTALEVDPATRFQTAQDFRRAIGLGCPHGALVEPDDLAALLVSTMAADIAREEQQAAHAAAHLARTEVLGSADVMSLASTSAGEGSDTPSRVRSTRVVNARKASRPSPWPARAAAVGLVLIGASGAWAFVPRAESISDAPLSSSAPSSAPAPAVIAPPASIVAVSAPAPLAMAEPARPEVLAPPIVSPVARRTRARHTYARPIDPIEAWGPDGPPDDLAAPDPSEPTSLLLVLSHNPAGTAPLPALPPVDDVGEATP